MTILEWVGLVAAAGVCAIWVSRIVQIYSTRARGPVLGLGTIPDAPPAGLVSIIIPGKDEEANIGAALETLRAQDYPEIEIIAVDDRSRDRTAEIIREAAARDPRIRLFQIKELPAGWFGKPHAMHTGAAAARGRWLLFVDADCRQAPHSARAAVNFLASRDAEMLSLWPVLEMHGFWENAVQP
ncbi:MAG: glycosyltransferase family A protein, partial [Planctomycetota bacterium]|nr:glycosyltransferase family A protein [Planctomycetota bacterium]